jgi:hypothetical protein
MLCTPRIKRDGYVYFHLSKGGVVTEHLGHRLVWEAFQGPFPASMETNHKNNRRGDNRLCNLELFTRSQNVAYGFSHNGRPSPNNPSPGSKNGSAKLTETNILEIVRLYQDGQLQWQIAEQFGVSQRAISLILRGEKWRHVPRPLFRFAWGGEHSKNRPKDPIPR